MILNNKIKTLNSTNISILALILFVISSFTAYAYPSGYTGATMSGCGGCHTGPNTAVTLSLKSGATTVNCGATQAFVVNSSRSGGTKIGFDVAITNDAGTSVGVISNPGSGFKIANNEITHSAKISSTTGDADCSFSWTAPNVPGTYYLRAVSTNGSGSKNNWNIMAPVTITVVGVPQLSVSPNLINFSDVKIGQLKDSAFTIKNTGLANLIVDSIIVSGANAVDFKIPNFSAPTTVTPNQSIYVIARFIPLTYASVKTATATVYSNAGTFALTMNGAGINAGAPILTPDPETIDLGKVNVFTTKDTSFKVLNTGTADLVVTSMTLSGADAAQFVFPEGTQGFTLGPNQTKIVNIQFAPKLVTSKITMEITFNCNALSAPKVKFTGEVKTSTSAILTPSTNNIDFGDVIINKFKDTTITLTNTGSVSMKLSSIGLGGYNPDEFQIMSGGIAELTPGAKINLTIRFAPTTIRDGKMAVVSFLSEATNDPTIELRGNGIAVPNQNIQVAESDVNFGKVITGKYKDTSITIKNTGTTKLKILKASISGTNASDFTIIGDWTKLTLNAGESQSYAIKFAPGAFKDRKATLNITSNALNSPSLDIPILGYGVDPAGVEEELNSGVKLYPNPANANVILEVNPDLSYESINVYDLSGNFVKTLTLVDGKINWDLKSYLGVDINSGTYFIKIKSGNDFIIKSLNVIR